MPSRSAVAKFVAELVTKLAPVALLAVVVALPACSINVKDKKNGDGESRVDIKTPVGDIHVNEQPDIRETGLTLYPGAKPAEKDDSDDKKGANVNISGPGFALKVVAAEFTSEDAPDKVMAYYNKELQKYGKVVECHGHWNGSNVGNISNDKGGSKPVVCSGDDKGNSVELKVGTEDNQHIVAVDRDGKRTKFALVYVRTHGKDDAI
jgi:hypothetical protein